MSPSRVEKILIVKTSALGDIVQSFPVLEYLRKKFPDAQIDWVVEKAGKALLTSHSLLSHALVIDTQKWRKTPHKKETWQEIRNFLRHLQKTEYDLLIDLQGNSKSALITLSAKAKTKVGFSWKTVSEKPNWFTTKVRYSPKRSLPASERYLYVAQNHLQDKQPFVKETLRLNITPADGEKLQEWRELAKKREKSLMICFGSKWKNKRLEEATLKSLISRIDSECAPFFFFIAGNASEKESATALHALFPNSSLVLDKLSLPLWQTLMSEVSAILAVDSVGLHLAGRTKTPSFSLFGPSALSVYKPQGERHAGLQGACPYGVSFEQHCPRLRTCSTGACLRNLSSDEIFTPFLAWWKANVL